MKYVSILLIPIVVTVVVLLMKKGAKNDKAEKNRNDTDFVIRVPQGTAWSGVFLSICCTCVIVFAMLFSDSGITWTLGLVLSVFACWGLYVIAKIKTWRLHVTGEQMVVTPLFGERKTHTFAEVTKVKMGMNDALVVYSDQKKLFAVQQNCVGYDLLFDRFVQERITFE